MHFTTGFVLAAAGLAVAQSSTSAAAPATSSSASLSGCGSAVDAIITQCLSSTQAILNSCKQNDWGCMCKAQQSVVTCYNNCPNDPAGAPARQQETSWCNAAKAYSTTSVPAATSGHVTAAGVSSSTTSMHTTATINSGFAGGASSSPSSTGNAANGLAPAGGLLAAIFGLALL